MWFLASLATAGVAHATIGFVCGDRDGSAYAGYAHLAVVPIALAVLAIVTALVTRSVLHRLARARTVDPIRALARHFSGAYPFVPWVAVCAGGVAALLGMEFSEQFVAFGHVESARAALGGSTVVGLAIVFASAALVTLLALRGARSLLSTAGAVALAVVAWIEAATRDLADAAAILRCARARDARRVPALVPQRVALRAPPRRSR